MHVEWQCKHFCGIKIHSAISGYGWCFCITVTMVTSQKHHGISNYRQLDCLFNSLFRITKRKYQSFAQLALYAGHSPATGGFLPQRTNQFYRKRFHVMTHVTVMEKYLVHGIVSHSVASGLWNDFKEISSRACFAFAVLKWLYIFACIVFLGTTKKGKIVCVFCYTIIYLQSSSFCDYI